MTEHDLPASRDDTGDYFRRRIDMLNQRIEDFQIEVDLSGLDITDWLREIYAGLRRDHDHAGEVARRLADADDDSWQADRDAAARCCDRLESDVATAWADLQAEKAAEPEAFRAAAQERIDTWRTHVDRLKVHAKLAEMEARDAVASLDDAFQHARPELERAGDIAGEALDVLKKRARDVVSHLREAARDFARNLD